MSNECHDCKAPVSIDKPGDSIGVVRVLGWERPSTPKKRSFELCTACWLKRGYDEQGVISDLTVEEKVR
jgi:hypothetical protein